MRDHEGKEAAAGLRDDAEDAPPHLADIRPRFELSLLMLLRLSAARQCLLDVDCTSATHLTTATSRTSSTHANRSPHTLFAIAFVLLDVVGDNTRRLFWWRLLVLKCFATP